jgi:hypothetical protein
MRTLTPPICAVAVECLRCRAAVRRGRLQRCFARQTPVDNQENARTTSSEPAKTPGQARTARGSAPGQLGTHRRVRKQAFGLGSKRAVNTRQPALWLPPPSLLPVSRTCIQHRDPRYGCGWPEVIGRSHMGAGALQLPDYMTLEKRPTLYDFHLAHWPPRVPDA